PPNQTLHLHDLHLVTSLLFFLTAPTTTKPYTLSLHDALPIYPATDGLDTLRDWLTEPGAVVMSATAASELGLATGRRLEPEFRRDRKSTRLNSSHLGISYAVFCLKKKKK